MKVPRSSEAIILKRIIRKVLIPPKSAVIRGIGDDCAVFRQRRAHDDLLFTCDLFLEDVHFRRDTHKAEDVGYKALARSLSDIAAMGGDPRFCLLSLAIPGWANEAWVDRFYSGFLRLAHQTATPLAGGDLARTDRFACDVTVCGSVPRGRMLLRSGARVDDAIYVSGLLGGSKLGLLCKKGRGVETPPQARTTACARQHAARAASRHCGNGFKRRVILGFATPLRRLRSFRRYYHATVIPRRHARSWASRRRGLRTAVHDTAEDRGSPRF